MVRQHRLPAVVTTLFVQTAPVFSWQQSSSVVQAQEESLVQRLPSAALQAVFPEETQLPPLHSPPQQS